jgi:uncharacterized membrane protein YphA (DoxX/SURF4 family)
MTKARIGTIALWIGSVLLALAFVLAGAPKLLRVEVWVDKFDGWGYASWFLVVIGGLELVGAILLLIPRLAVAGAALLAVIMLGAGYTHLANGEGLEVIRPLVFLGVLIPVGWARRPEQMRR